MEKKVVYDVLSSEKENIEVVEVMSDRLLMKALNVEPTKKSDIIDPNTRKPYEDEEMYDRHPYRGEIVYVGEKIKKEFPNIVPGMCALLERPDVGYLLKINGVAYFQTRISNIMLFYKNL